MPVVMARLFEAMKEATGLDLADIMKAESLEAQTTRNINLTGAPDIIIGDIGKKNDGAGDAGTPDSQSGEAHPNA